MADDDDDGCSAGLFESGHWEWDDTINALAFVSDLPPTQQDVVIIQTKAPVGAIEFKDDIDLVEQFRYRRRYQRRIMPGEPNVVTLQDVKDLAIYTAPTYIMSPMLINVLHLPTTERFLRALILFCAYYLQIAQEMTIRAVELETKVRTPDSEKVENEYQNNLSDLRALVAKEYSTLLMGGNDFKKFHHMGPEKKSRSLSDKDARLIETLIRVSVQIVWIALGRQSFHKIELEINRILKTEIFNNVEHTLKTNYITEMPPMQKKVLLGKCIRYDKKLKTRSPLINEVFCHRVIDYHLMGLGVIRYPHLISSRLNYLLMAIHGPEHTLEESGVVLGIIGMRRSVFDTMLRPIPTTAVDDINSKSGVSVTSRSSSRSIKNIGSKKSQAKQITYPAVVLPKKTDKQIEYPPSFPDVDEGTREISQVQKNRWLQRLANLTRTNRAA